ncbi:hypothetical protein [Clostridium frigidicarnis]|uniref:Uncharacterized protein n=1 Tax=Clostridium frigidicarnis TaxID=84698 RepID=A0A1I0YSR2_9CLOT|nr:hypothetical protein [Clostridium frigidicarnis]SFB15143.1 hypothetical protein SAMN04488528_101460 [Clostridium frigidicarnis]
MKETSLKLAQQDIDEALNAVESLEEVLDEENLSPDKLRNKFLILSKKVQELENILKTEGII